MTLALQAGQGVQFPWAALKPCPSLSAVLSTLLPYGRLGGWAWLLLLPRPRPRTTPPHAPRGHNSQIRQGAEMNVPLLQSPTQSHAAQPVQMVQVLWRQTAQALQAGLQDSTTADRTHLAGSVGGIVVIHDGKVWIARRRCHHGLLGAVTTTIGALTRRLGLVAVGSYWMWDDRKDWPWPMSKFSLR